MPYNGSTNPIEILHQDDCLIVAIKPAGVPVHTDRREADGFVDVLKRQLDLEYLSLIHRLDQPVSGIILLAKTKEGAADLSRQSKNREMKKDYRAVLWYGGMETEGELRHYLVHDEKKNLTTVHDEMHKDGQLSILKYKKTGEALLEVESYGVDVDPDIRTLTCVDIRIVTGRTHQIRSQFAHIGHPVFGDRKYASRMPLDKIASYDHPGFPALASCGLAFTHPSTGEWVSFSWKPDTHAFRIFQGGSHEA